MRFYLGVPEPSWRVEVPTFVSARRLRRRKSAWDPHPGRWAVDSGGFTEISSYGKWQTSAVQYAEELERWADERGRPDWAAPQDWMCEPQMLKRTGLTVAEHQERTVASVLLLRALLRNRVHIIPVLQGWELPDYLRCVELYETAGFDLQAERVVGVGTVCRRQNTAEGTAIMSRLAAQGLKLHGFGFKTTGLLQVGGSMASADSMAWSVTARNQQIKLTECKHKAKNCASCPRWAQRWRNNLLIRLNRQRRLFGGEIQ